MICAKCKTSFDPLAELILHGKTAFNYCYPCVFLTPKEVNMATKEIEIACTVKHETDKAMLINDGDKDVWIPKSKITDYSETGNVIESIFIPEWLALEKELI